MITKLLSMQWAKWYLIVGVVGFFAAQIVIFTQLQGIYGLVGDESLSPEAITQQLAPTGLIVNVAMYVVFAMMALTLLGGSILLYKYYKSRK